MLRAAVANRLRSAAQGAVLVLAVALPFEATEPVTPLGPLQLSSVELFLYAALALWGAALVLAPRDRDRVRVPTPAAHFAVAALMLVTIASAALAPVARGAAVKFMLRSAGGVVLYFAAADLLRARDAPRRFAGALGVGAAVAATAAIAETFWSGTQNLLMPFHAQSFQVFGLLRASGPFQYPNIASMYLEAVAPVLLLAAAGALWLRAGVALALLAAVMLTASRTGLVTATALFAGLALTTRAARRPALVMLAGLVVLAAAGQVAGDTLALRLRFWHDGAWYRANVVATDVPPAMDAGTIAETTVGVRNLGARSWPREGGWPVKLSYHWLDAATGQPVIFEGGRSLLPGDVAPGDSAVVQATVRAPDYGGRYVLWWDLVHEHVTWFSERGEAGARQAITVYGPPPPPEVASHIDGPVSPLRAPLEELSRRTLWRAGLAAWRAHPLLGMGPDNFRHTLARTAGVADADERLHANSLYVETLADLGTAGVLALVALLLTLVQAARDASTRPANVLLAAGFAAGVAAFFVHGALDYFLEFTPTYALFWLLAGALVALSRPEPRAAHAAEAAA